MTIMMAIRTRTLMTMTMAVVTTTITTVTITIMTRRKAIMTTPTIMSTTIKTKAMISFGRYVCFCVAVTVNGCEVVVALFSFCCSSC